MLVLVASCGQLFEDNSDYVCSPIDDRYAGITHYLEIHNITCEEADPSLEFIDWALQTEFSKEALDSIFVYETFDELMEQAVPVLYRASSASNYQTGTLDERRLTADYYSWLVSCSILDQISIMHIDDAVERMMATGDFVTPLDFKEFSEEMARADLLQMSDNNQAIMMMIISAGIMEEMTIEEFLQNDFYQQSRILRTIWGVDMLTNSDLMDVFTIEELTELLNDLQMEYISDRSSYLQAPVVLRLDADDRVALLAPLVLDMAFEELI